MTELKREYVVPLRRKTKVAPKWRRSKKAVSVLNEFIKKHMKTDNVILCNELNEKIWENGIKNPPGKVSIVALKTEINGIEKTLVNLVEFGVENQLKSYNSKQSKVKETKKTVTEGEVKEVETETKKEISETETKIETKKEEVKQNE